MTISEMRQLLTANGIRLTKSLGQNFLHDSNQLRRIVVAAELTRSDIVLEIGPGLGPLTELLLAHAGQVLAIEKDARLVQSLTARLEALKSGNAGHLTLIHDDAVDFLRREQRDWTRWKVVSNLPYSVASPLLVELSQAERGPQLIVATLQLEVARRLMATAGNADYGLLTLLIQLNYEPKQFFKIPSSCFFPEPEVDSACVVLIRRPEAFLPSTEKTAFMKVVKRAFSQRRKMMMKLLKEDWPLQKLDAAFEALQLSPEMRAESVSLEQFVKLTKILCELPYSP